MRPFTRARNSCLRSSSAGGPPAVYASGELEEWPTSGNNRTSSTRDVRQRPRARRNFRPRCEAEIEVRGATSAALPRSASARKQNPATRHETRARRPGRVFRPEHAVGARQLPAGCGAPRPAVRRSESVPTCARSPGCREQLAIAPTVARCTESLPTSVTAGASREQALGSPVWPQRLRRFVDPPEQLRARRRFSGPTGVRARTSAAVGGRDLRLAVTFSSEPASRRYLAISGSHRVNAAILARIAHRALALSDMVSRRNA